MTFTATATALAPARQQASPAVVSLERPALTVDMIKSYLANVDGKPRTVETYARNLRQFKDWLDENGITHPTRQDILAYRDYLRATYKPTTTQAYIGAVKRLFAWLDTAKLYPDIARGVKGASVGQEFKKDYLTADQVKDILAGIDRSTLKGKRDFALFALAVTAGLRTIELSRADIGDVQLKAGGYVLYLQGKGRDGKNEYEKIAHPVYRALLEYLNARGDHDPESPLFASTSNNNAGRRMTTRSISQAIKDSMTQAGYDSPRLTAHSLRHTAITLAILAGEDLQDVQIFARHKSLETTMIYNHAIDKASNSCAGAVASAIF